jgi:hypothetical protein
VKKTVFTHAKVNKRRLYAGLDIDYPPFINIADVAAKTRSFDIKLLKAASLDYRHPALFSLSHIYEHFS